jgi:hypothetical protein
MRRGAVPRSRPCCLCVESVAVLFRPDPNGPVLPQQHKDRFLPISKAICRSFAHLKCWYRAIGRGIREGDGTLIGWGLPRAYWPALILLGLTPQSWLGRHCSSRGEATALPRPDKTKLQFGSGCAPKRKAVQRKIMQESWHECRINEVR